MQYIPRRLSVTTFDGEKRISETDFLAMPGPLVVLGEPGAGKSEFVGQLRELEGVDIYKASAVTSFPTSLPKLGRQSRIVIDALDEVTAYASGAPFPQVLQKIAHDNLSNFIFTCRAVDWQDEVNADLIFARWQTSPVIGRLLPLEDDEIVRFVDTNGKGQNGKHFLESAYKHNSIDLLRNPQTLVMLIDTVSRSGWPKTRTQLYEESCKALVREDNSFHKTVNKTRPVDSVLLDCAGFIGAQMILANKATINLQGKTADGAASLHELSTDTYTTEIIRQCVSTKIFRTAAPDAVEGSHRTVLEFLGAKYIVKALGSKLSILRLERLLYADGRVVPPALRGLHSWIATLDNGAVAKEFISSDPYGVFRYGDSAMLSLDILRHLLACLRQLAIDDPNFRNDDWHISPGKGFANLPKGDLIALLKNPGVHFTLTHLVLSSIRGEKVGTLITDELIAIIINPARTPAERNAALDVLQDSQVSVQWTTIVDRMISLGDMESLRLALDVIRSAKSVIPGEMIARVVIGVTIASHRGPSYAGIGYGLANQLDKNQIRDTLTALVEYRFSEADLEPLRDDPKSWIFDLLMAAFQTSMKLESRIIWRAFKRLRRYQNHKRDRLDDASAKYFADHPRLRTEVQWEALFNNNDGEKLWWNYFRLQEASDVLTLSEPDALTHLEHIMTDEESLRLARWTSMVWYVLRNPNFTHAKEIVEEQAKGIPELSGALAELTQPPKQDPEEDKFKRETKKWERHHEAERRKRHASYEEVREKILSGKQIDAIGFIAEAYLGWFGDIKADTPSKRVTELVGENLGPHVLGSFEAAMGRDDIPTMQAIVELNVNEKKKYLFEPILIAGCSLIPDLNALPFDVLRSALAACSWDVYYHEDKITPQVQARLEAIVFSTPENTEAFVRDWFEPRFKISIHHVSGLSRLATDDYFTAVAGQLSMEWLERFDQIAASTTDDLLKSAFRYNPVPHITALAQRKITAMANKENQASGIWHAILFFFDFENSRAQIGRYFSTDRSRFWQLRDGHNQYYKRHRLSPDQNYFILSLFGPSIGDNDEVHEGFAGNEHPWEASEFLLGRANELGTETSSRSTELLELLLKEILPPSRLLDHLKHVYSQHVRLKAESNLRQISLDNVRSILLNQAPQTPPDLQSVILEQLILLGRKIRNSPTNGYVVYWDGESPRDENYCRDRLVDALTSQLDHLGIRVHTEGRMPENNRCDFLNTLSLFDLPVEVKGQWHRDVWTAAVNQLEDYSREYRAEGYGIYLVLWFGPCEKVAKEPKCDPQGRIPTSAVDLLKLLEENYHDKISTKTKLYVLDVSRPAPKSKKSRKKPPAKKRKRTSRLRKNIKGKSKGR